MSPMLVQIETEKPKEVFVVVSGEYDDFRIMAVCDSREKADEIAFLGDEYGGGYVHRWLLNKRRIDRGVPTQMEPDWGDAEALFIEKQRTKQKTESKAGV